MIETLVELEDRKDVELNSGDIKSIGLNLLFLAKYKMTRNTITLLFFFFQIFTFGQGKLLKDLDHDGIKDSMY